MKAELLFKDKYIYRDGAIREMVIWRLPAADAGRPHGLKYRLYYGQSGQCLVRYDNEQGKGDHRHYGDGEGNEREEDYAWISVQQLMADFKGDIEQLRGDQDD
ncbi:toxin-antitoxin system TumE family protein [Sedimenticola hydrogenitrophicus]|uniref:toxin-antitoxin system TumE family protein n=1 Tax=Sedimenticola hydrogenitrophicus TaxID=2967975 RepID=UPI0023B062AD|nr:DUF6516 family protein [Sedimenticola hydrogenitrophicus]